MYKEIGIFEYSNAVLEKMLPGNFLTTRQGSVINTMIIGWGGINVIWGRPIFMVLVRDSRATYGLIESSGEFTVSIPFDDSLKGAIRICGTRSLRDINKFEYCGLTPIKGRVIDTPIIAEAKLHYECKVIYKQPLNQSLIPDIVKSRYYDNGANHTVYYGEIVDKYIYVKEWYGMAIILDGKKLSLKIREEIKTETESLINKYNKQPHLVVILVGENPASQSYVKSKERACIKAGIKSTIIRRDNDILESELIEIIENLNSDDSVHGILLQLPIPKHLDEDKIINLISPKKDVDGFCNINVAKLNKGQDALVPCTPLGITKILEEYEIDPKGKHCVIIGRSQIVGKPMAALMLKRNATVTICHSKTTDMKSISKQADILIVAIGRANMIDASYIKPGATVIDVGINRVDEKIIGDVLFEEAEKVAGFITPVPGGVGPMTIACLLDNTLTCFKRIEA